MEASTEQEPTIEERLAELYAEMDVIIDKFIDERAAACIGVPHASIELVSGQGSWLPLPGVQGHSETNN
jgi:hypothetical protein